MTAATGLPTESSADSPAAARSTTPASATDQWLTTRDAAERLGVSVSRVAQLAKSGKLPAEREGRVWFIRLSDVEARKVALEAAPSWHRVQLFRITDHENGNVRTADYLGQGKLRYAATRAQVAAVVAMKPGTVLEFETDFWGPARWTVECLKTPGKGKVFGPPRLRPGMRILLMPGEDWR